MMRSLLVLGLAHAASAACPSRLSPGEHMVGVGIAGVERTFFISVPVEVSTPRPAVTMWHGCGSSPEKFELESQMNVNAAERNVYNIYPQGTGTPRLGWNAGFSQCSTGGLVNDVDFARAVVLYAIENLCVETTEIYAAGFSNGGSMVFNLTCAMSDTFSAFSFTGASMPQATYPAACGAAFVRPVLGMCGSQDGCSSGMASWLTAYSGISNCTDGVNTTEYSATTTCHEHATCGAGEKSPLSYCMVQGLGHCWSGNDCCDQQCSGQDPANIDASAHVLSFFDKVPKEAAVQLDQAALAKQLRAQLNASNAVVRYRTA